MRKSIILGLVIGLLTAAAILLWRAGTSHPAAVTAVNFVPANSSEGTAKEHAFQTLRSGNPTGPRPSSQSGDNTFIDVFSSSWGFQPRRISAESARVQQERKEQELQEIIAKDIGDGVNAEARAKEAKLRSLVDQLRVNFSPEEAFQVLGSPHVLRSIVIESNIISMPSAANVKDIVLGVEILASYWPRVGVPFDGHNGQGYDVLHLIFDQDHRLKHWQWDRPEWITSGSMEKVRRETEYWEGKHALSGPPPAGAN